MNSMPILERHHALFRLKTPCKRLSNRSVLGGAFPTTNSLLVRWKAAALESIAQYAYNS